MENPQCLVCGKLKEWEKMGDINGYKVQVCLECLKKAQDVQDKQKSNVINKN